MKTPSNMIETISYVRNDPQLIFRSFPEDASLENGNYTNVCLRCNMLFVGYKRRTRCKICENLEK
jgi:hypothetical protein